VSSFEIPSVETERLVLRAFRAADLDAFAAMSADPEVMRYIGTGATVDRNGSFRTMAGFNGQWSLCGVSMWAVECKADGAFIGRIGLYHPPYWPCLEMGWVLTRTAWGQGYAREGARACLDYARRVLKPDRLASFIAAGNDNSVRVAEALGARYEGQSDLLGAPVLVYVHELDDRTHR
jgi:RimJ/RimL family protein N-acetyltransferase